MLLSKLGDKSNSNITSNAGNTTNSISSKNTTTTETNTIEKKENTNTTNEVKSQNNTKKNETNTTTQKETNTSTTSSETKNTQTGLTSYKAIWQYPDSTYPEREFRVQSISDSKVNFDFIVEGITTFENASATISGNTANFDIKNEGDWNIKGTITFTDNTVIFDIKESSSENIPTGSTTFKVKSNKSAF